MEQNYIKILIQSLEKKIKILEELVLKNQEQKRILQEEEMDMDAFQASIDSKAGLIEQVGFLDEGFEQMYQRVKGILEEQKESYRQEIITLKQFITRITELTMEIQREEQENRKLAEIQFSNTRKQLRQVKTSRNVASKYYNNMAKLNYIDPQFMDKKK